MIKKTFVDLESEKLILCQMLLDNRIIPEVTTVINKNAFSNPVHVMCYEYIIRKFSQGAKVDELLFINDLKEVETQTKVEISSATFSAANWNVYAGRIKNCYAAREVQKNFLSVLEDLSAENVTDITAAAMENVNDVLSNITRTRIVKYSDLIPAWMNKVEERYSNKNAALGTPTGLENIDDLFGGGLQDELIYLAARPSIGKTALALQIANTMSAKKNVLFFELEMTENGITERAVANASSIDIKTLRSGFLTLANFQTLQETCTRLFDNQNISFAFPEKRSIRDIITTIRARVMTDKVNAVFIDHIGLITPEGNHRSSWEGVAEISHKLQQLQRELKIPFFILTQLNRGAEGKDGELDNAAGSDTTVQDADVYMILNRERQKEASETMIPTKLVVKKNRNGACGTCYLTFLPRQVMFVVDNNPPPEEPEKGKRKFA